MNTSPTSPRSELGLMTEHELAAHLKICRRQLFNWCVVGLIPYSRRPRQSGSGWRRWRLTNVNGRLGCLLIALLLHQGGLLTQPPLYLSLYHKQHRPVYYDLLDRVRTIGDWEAWVDFFLEGVEATSLGAVDTARRLVALFDEDTRRPQQSGRSAANALVCSPPSASVPS